MTVADLLAGVRKALGVTPNTTKAMANSPAVLKAYLTSPARSAAVRCPLGCVSSSRC